VAGRPDDPAPGRIVFCVIKTAAFRQVEWSGNGLMLPAKEIEKDDLSLKCDKETSVIHGSDGSNPLAERDIFEKISFRICGAKQATLDIEPPS